MIYILMRKGLRTDETWTPLMAGSNLDQLQRFAGKIAGIRSWTVHRDESTVVTADGGELSIKRVPELEAYYG